MSDFSELSKEQKEELEELIEEISSLSVEVLEDYKINPSELSGSVTQIHIDSPFLDGDQDDSK